MLAKKLQSALAGGGGDKLYVESVFSTYLYTGNGSTQTITNGIDLASEGGLVWARQRNDLFDHSLFDTERGVDLRLRTNTTNAETTNSGWITSFNSDGFSLGSGSLNSGGGSANYASWTFRKAPKFFDVVTYTGNGTAGRTVAHNLGSVPGAIIVKKTNDTGPWVTYHRSLGATKYLYLHSSNSEASFSGFWNDTSPTDSVFTVGNNSAVNESGETYVAYLFAHDAGGFGDSGDENVISCGSYTGNGSETNGTEVNLGWEPQWLLVKASSTTADWFLVDNMRGWGPPDLGISATLKPNLSDAENSAAYNTVELKPTGFKLHSTSDDWNGSGSTYIYIAIRRGPMKTPESGTEVFAIDGENDTAPAPPTYNSGFPVDFALMRRNVADTSSWYAFDRLRSNVPALVTNDTSAEFSAGGTYNSFDSNVGLGTYTGTVYANAFAWMFRRAPGFFDVVCYTGTGVAGRTVSHNLGVAPEMILVKKRSALGSWYMYVSSLGATKYMQLNDNDVAQTSTQWWNDTEPTSTVFSLGDQGAVNGSGDTFVAYLFATVAGVSKVGSYTGTGTTLQVNCGFSTGARFVLIKRTDTKITTDPTTGWYVWDSARGIVSGNDPYLLLNSTDAEVTSTDYIDPYSAGFEISSSAPAAINASGGSFIYLAIA